MSAVDQERYGIGQGRPRPPYTPKEISCPSCGRTLFDLEETTARIKSRTAHLKGVKIAVMGCVVNGPGEMADADFGYVGWGEEKIALFVGKEMVAKDIPTDSADDRLVELIRKASVKPKIRIKRKRSAASKRRMLEAKRRRSSVKQMRKKVGRTDQ